MVACRVGGGGGAEAGGGGGGGKGGGEREKGGTVTYSQYHVSDSWRPSNRSSNDACVVCIIQRRHQTASETRGTVPYCLCFYCAGRQKKSRCGQTG